MRTYLVSIEVHLSKPLELVSGEGGAITRLAGFVQELSVRAEDEAAMRAFVRAEVDGAELGPDQKSEIIFIEIDELDPGMEPPGEPGVYGSSGRSFYSEE